MNDNGNKETKITALIEGKENIFDKIANFFRKIFKRNNEKQTISSSQSFESNKNDKKQNFQNTIKLEHDYEEKRLLNLQKQFENNSISENEISEDDKIALKGLYYIQMLKSKMKIKIYKEKLNGIKTTQVDFSYLHFHLRHYLLIFILF